MHIAVEDIRRQGIPVLIQSLPYQFHDRRTMEAVQDLLDLGGRIALLAQGHGSLEAKEVFLVLPLGQVDHVPDTADRLGGTAHLEVDIAHSSIIKECILGSGDDS